MSVSATSPLSKHAKKLAAFHKEKEKSSNRFKAVVAFCESEGIAETEVKPFFLEFYEQIFAVTYERFLHCQSTQFKKGKGIKDLLSILSILKKIIIYLPEVIRTRWQIDKIGSIIEKCLCFGNQQAVRVVGFDLLLYFIEALQNSMEEKQIQLFACAINLHPFINNGEQKVVLKHLPNPELEKELLIPAAEPASKKDAMELLDDVLLEFITKKTNNFLFWFNLFKEKYLMTFYPKIFQELRLLDKYDDSGFKSGCPHEIQAALVQRLSVWGENNAVFPILWDTTFNGPILLEISRQTCLLPLSYNTTIRTSIQMFRSWLTNSQKNKAFAEHIQTYWQHFVKNLALIFTIETPEADIDTHYGLCLDVLLIYNHFAVELSAKLTKETWEVLQYTVLMSIFDLLNKTSPNSSSHSHTTFILLNKTTPPKNDTLAENLFGCLYFFWIRSQISNEEMWKDLSKKVSSLVNWKANLLQWKDKMLQLTYVLREYVYEKHKKPLTLDGTEPTLGSATQSHATIIGRKTTDEKFAKTRSRGSETISAKASPLASRDVRITGMNWTAESITETWYTMLHVLGNITKISDPISYEIAMSAVSEIVEILVTAEEKLPLTASEPIPTMKVFLPWLIEACVYDERLMRGMLLAYRTLCTLFCRRHTHTYTTPQQQQQQSSSYELSQLLAHFYRIIHVGLNNVKSEIIWEIIEDSTGIFTFDLPGVAVLIPDYLREIEVLCGPKTSVPVGVKGDALRIVNSLICYPNHFDGLDFPVVAQPKPYETKKDNSLTSDDVKEKISKILLSVLSNINEDTNNILLAICGATVLIFEELHFPNTRTAIVTQLIGSMLECCDHADPTVSQTSIESLTSFTLLYDKLLTRCGKGLIVNIINSMSDKVIKLIKQQQSKRENVVSGLLYCLRDWLVCDYNDLLSDKEIVTKIFQAMEYALLGELVSERAARVAAENSGNNPAAGGGAGGSNEKKPKKDKDKKLTSFLSRTHLFEAIFEELKNSPTHGSYVIREAAEITLLQLLNQYNSYPSPGGCDVTSSQIGEDDSPPGTTTLYFVYNDLIILTLSELQAPGGGKTTRVILRDATGKYVWDVTQLFERNYNNTNNNYNNSNSASNNSSDDKKEAEAGTTTTTSSTEVKNQPKIYNLAQGELPKFEENPNVAGVDMLNQLLSYLSQTHPDLKPPSDNTSGNSNTNNNSNNTSNSSHSSFTLPLSSFDSVYADAIQEKMQAIATQHAQEQERVKQLQHTPLDRPPLPSQNQSTVSLSTFQNCRLFLSNLGFLGSESRKRLHLVDMSTPATLVQAHLQPSPTKFLKNLRDLDQLPGRELFKMGVVYVGAGQEDENDILRTANGSELYNEFLRGLGWMTEAKGSPIGDVFPQFVTAVYEILFHAATMMPNLTDEHGNTNLAEKKKFISSDLVHIVWSEHKRDYRPNTIASQYNDSQIVIYPLPNGLFRIQINQKEKISFFGPLVDGMVLNKTILCMLVRQTALYAAKRARSLQAKHIQKPFPTRNILIKETIQRFKSEKTFDDFVASLYPTQPIVIDSMSSPPLSPSAPRMQRTLSPTNSPRAAPHATATTTTDAHSPVTRTISTSWLAHKKSDGTSAPSSSSFIRSTRTNTLMANNANSAASPTTTTATTPTSSTTETPTAAATTDGPQLR